ncbi:hypothetical protein BH10PSE3_BH10PSE3_12170 [soil metagenome]
MATIVIGVGASSSYPLTSDNVLGPPAALGPLSFSNYINYTSPQNIIAEDADHIVFTYASGVAIFTFFWTEGGVDKTAEMRFNLSSLYYDLPFGGPGGTTIGEGSFQVNQIQTDGITFTPTTPFGGLDSVGHGGFGPLPFGGIRNFNFLPFDDNNPATLLAGADTITNLSATGALLAGYAGADTIVGGVDADTLDGGSGNDSMSGGLGNDVYIVDYNADKIIEMAGQGFDTVLTSNSFTLGAGVSIERIVASGTANVSITGNGQAVQIIGNAGVNTLDDGGGAATMKGGTGTDVYLVHNTATQVIELVGEGYDTVKTDLAAYTLAANVEVLTHLGSAAFAGTGNALSNVLTGGAGADTLNGAGGNDVLTGGGGADRFVFDNLISGQDRITDFFHGVDLIALGAGFGIASLANVVLVADSTAVAAGQAALHYYANGALSFDATGGSLADAVIFASLDGHPSLAIADFVLV